MFESQANVQRGNNVCMIIMTWLVKIIKSKLYEKSKPNLKGNKVVMLHKENKSFKPDIVCHLSNLCMQQMKRELFMGSNGNDRGSLKAIKHHNNENIAVSV
jgi:hypothetical protein